MNKVVLQNIQHSDHLWEDEDFVPTLFQFGEEFV